MAAALPQSVFTATRGYFAGMPGWARVFLATFVVYALATLGGRTGWNAHTQLAWSILNGSYSLSDPFGTTEFIHDPTGRKFIAYGPAASILLMPFVAVFGREVNQTMVSALFGAAAVALWWGFLGRMDVSARSRLWLTGLFAVGTPFAYYAAQNGNNWAITHCTAVLCVMATFCLARAGHPGWAGLFFGLAVLSRNPVLYMTPAVLLVALAPAATTWRQAWSEIRAGWPVLAIFGLGAVVSLSLGAYYNWERFGTPFENGYRQILLADPIADFGRKPAFALEYARHNVPFYLFNPPVALGKFPWYGPDHVGMSLLLATPVLLLLPFVNYRKPLNLVALLCILAIQAMYWLFIGDGRGQFGMRYTTDYLPLVMLLVASLTASRFGRVAIALTALGVAVEIWGFLTWFVMKW